MYDAKITIDLDILDAIADTAQRSPKLMQTAYKRNTSRLRKRVLGRLSKEPPVWKGKRRWKSEKQRRYVIAMLRAAGKLPYPRTHALSEGWEVDVIDDGDGGILQATNPSPYVRYVQGDDAQPMHLDSGWEQAGEVIADARVEAEEVLIQTWFTIADPTAGVR